MLECLNRSVMYLDSLPQYVNVDHFRSLSVVGGRGGGVWVIAGSGGIGKELLWRIWWIVFNSFWYSSCSRW